MKKVLSVMLAMAMMLTLFAGCGGEKDKSADGETKKVEAGESKDSGDDGEKADSSDGGEITLAFVGPQTGDNAEYGKSMKAAIQIAIDEWNEKGGVNGQQIKLVDYDDANTSEQAASVAQKIVGDESVSAVIGHFSSGVAMTASEVYEESGIAYISGSAAHVDLTKIGDCIYRNNAVYATDANTMLQIVQYLGLKKIGILNPNSDAGVAVTTEIQNMMEAYGDKYDAELVLAELYEDGTVDFSATVSKFEEAGVECVYSSGAYAQTAPFIKQYREKNKDVQFIMSAACFSQEFLELAGADAEGVVLGTSFFYESSDEAVKAFSEKFNEVYGSNPSTFCGQVYDATYAILYAIEKGGSADRAAILENLPSTDFQGVTGKITFDEEGNCPKQQVLLKVEGGKYVEIPNVLKSQTDYEKELGVQ